MKDIYKKHASYLAVISLASYIFRDWDRFGKLQDVFTFDTQILSFFSLSIMAVPILSTS